MIVYESGTYMKMRCRSRSLEAVGQAEPLED